MSGRDARGSLARRTTLTSRVEDVDVRQAIWLSRCAASQLRDSAGFPPGFAAERRRHAADGRTLARPRSPAEQYRGARGRCGEEAGGRIDGPRRESGGRESGGVMLVLADAWTWDFW